MDLPPISGGGINYNGGATDIRPVDIVATYSCTDSSHTLVGDSTRTCLSTGDWSGSEPTCQPTCDDLPVISNGVITYDPDSSPRLVGNMATYDCDSGYDISVTTTRVCQSDGSWDGAEPTCDPVDCMALTAPGNGTVDTSGGTTFLNTATYSCDPGYTLNGDSIRTCEATGDWSVMAPTCDIVDCGSTDLMTPANGMPVSFTSTTFGSSATYSCVTGYTIDGDSTRMCGPDGMWTPAAPTCQIVDCGSTDLTDPGNGMVTFDATTFGEEATYQCDSGYVLDGSDVRTCGDDGDWTPAAPTCPPVNCGTNDLVMPTNGMVMFSATTFGSGATYSCDLGYELNGASTRTCGANLMWTPMAPSCDEPVPVAMLTMSGPTLAGGSLTLNCSVSGVDSLSSDTSISYDYEILQNSVSRSATATLTLDPLLLSDGGDYSCVVVITSSLLPSPLMDTSDDLVITVMIPTPTVTIADPSPVFVGSSPELTCTVTVDANIADTAVTASVLWDGPNGAAFDSASNEMLTAGSATVTTTLATVTTSDTGDYTCRATLSSVAGTAPSDEGTVTRTITIYDTPSSPTVMPVTPQSTSITVSWTQPAGELVQNYEVSLDYLGPCGDPITSVQTEMVAGDAREVTFMNLEELSSYQITITATNGAGSSDAVSTDTTTLPAAPDMGVADYSVSDFNSSSVTLTWGMVPCINRNSEITGYRITYGVPTMTETVPGAGTLSVTISGLIPRRSYTFTIVPTSDSGDGPARSQTQEAALSPVVGLYLRGNFYTDNNIILDSTAIGSELEALICVTNIVDCCRMEHTDDNIGAGNWFDPTGTGLPFSLPGDPNMVRGPSVVRLNAITTPGSGVYRCDIPSSSGDTTINVGLYPPGEGAPVVTGVVFSRSETSLTCTSTGGPATTVAWTRDGVTVSSDDYNLTQTVTDTATATYENVLTASSIGDLVGTFVCTVSNDRGFDSASITRTGVTIVDPPSTVTVGSSVTLTCELDAPGDIEWRDSTGVVASGNGSSLQYTINPVMDSMHNTVLTCRGPGGDETITINVDVPASVLELSFNTSGSAVAGGDYSVECSVSTTVAGLTNIPTAQFMASGDNIAITNTGAMSTLSFTGVRTSQAVSYTCVATLVSPALDSPLMVPEDYTVTVQIATPDVSITEPTGTLYAGTPGSLTCSISLPLAVDTDVVVDFTWDNPIASTVNGSPFTNTLSVPVLSTTHTMATCRATVRASVPTANILDSSEGSNSISINVKAPPPPTVMINESGSRVAGTSLTLTCTATPGTPNLVSGPVVSWVGITDSGSVLTFDPLRTSNGAMYTCEADYDIPDADLSPNPGSAFTIITVQIPPPTAIITLEPMAEDNIYTVGLSLTLNCVVTFPEYVNSLLTLGAAWTRDSTAVMSSGDKVTVNDFTMPQGSRWESTVEYTPLDTDLIANDTLYECDVTVSPQDDAFITGTTANADTTISVKDAIFTVALTPEVTVLAGGMRTLTCQGTRGVSADGSTLDLEWFYGGAPVVNSPDLTVTGDSSTLNTSISSSLVFSSIATSQAGEYTCRVNRTVPGTDIIDQNIDRVVVVNVQINTPDVLVSINRDGSQFEGTTGLIVTCTITPDLTGVDTPPVTTRILSGPDSNRINEADETDGVITLQRAIEPVRMNDQGTYTCSMTVASVSSVPNAAYILSATRIETVDLTVQELPAPTVVVTPPPTSVAAGQSLSLICTVSSVDLLAMPPVTTWTNSTDHIVSTESELTFSRVRTSDADSYTCTGSINIPTAGIIDRSTVDTVDVRVTTPPPTVVLDAPAPVYHGTIHTLSCSASYDTDLVDTDPTLDFQWTLNETSITNDSFTLIEGTSTSSSLTLNPVNEPSLSSGQYVCSVTLSDPNPLVIMSEDSQTVSFDVQDPPPIMIQPAVPTRAGDGRCTPVQTIQCDASIISSFAVQPMVMWFAADNQLVDEDSLLNYDASTDGTGVFTCRACANVPSVNILDNCINTSVVIQNTTPAPVMDPSCTTIDGTQLRVEWTPVTAEALGYQVLVEEYTAPSQQVTQTELNDDEVLEASTTLTGLAPGRRYEVTIETVSAIGCSATTTIIECYTQELPPPDIQNVTISRINGTAMMVQWNPINLVAARGFLEFLVTYSRFDPSARRKRQSETETVNVPGDQSEIVIGGLSPEDLYDVQVQATTGAGGSTPSPLMRSPATPSSSLGIIVAIIIVLIVLIIVVVVAIVIIVVMIRRHKSRGNLKLSTGRNYELSNIGDNNNAVQATAATRVSERVEETTKEKEALDETAAVQPAETPAEVMDRIKPVSLTSFRTHVQDMHDDRAKGFEAEYQSFSLVPLQDHELAKIPHNRAKNRFANIFPFDHTRVLLKEIPGVDGSDYINACWLDGYNRERCYIAAQGPMPNSLEDFWRMIWEYKITNIVMLTKCKEGGRVKCEQYWAEDIGDVFESAGKLVSVTTISVVPFADFVVRQFTVKNKKEPGSEPLKVNQYHFTSWPDHGVPKFATSLIAFIRKTQRGHNKDAGPPLLVHCSAGVGRTGTFITLDAMLERIHKETSVNVYGFVKHMRSQRVLMVQTLAQYSFIHDALAELITCGETDIPAGALRTKFRLLSKVIPGKAITGFTNQFQLLEEVSRVIDTEDLTDANERFNKEKNRYPDRIPFNMSRARLRPTGEDGSEYINASFVDGYKHRNAYIATQAPMKTTVNDLWRMIWEFKSKTIVMLCNNEERGQESSAVYWPDKEDEVTLYGKINVTLQSKAPYGDFIVKKFAIQEDRPAGAKQLEGFTVTQFHHTEWPIDGRPNTGTLIEMLDMLTKQQMTSGNRPITVMCDDGCGRTGTLICIHAQLERLKTEGVVDFFQSIKSARIQRAGLVPDVTSYAYCHEVLTDFIDKFDNYANFKDMV